MNINSKLWFTLSMFGLGAFVFIAFLVWLAAPGSQIPPHGEQQSVPIENIDQLEACQKIVTAIHDNIHAAQEKQPLPHTLTHEGFHLDMEECGIGEK